MWEEHLNMGGGGNWDRIPDADTEVNEIEDN